MAKGSFSYYAGLVSDGIKLREAPTAADLRPQPDWLSCSAGGEFDEDAFVRLLEST